MTHRSKVYLTSLCNSRCTWMSTRNAKLQKAHWKTNILNLSKCSFFIYISCCIPQCFHFNVRCSRDLARLTMKWRWVCWRRSTLTITSPGAMQATEVDSLSWFCPQHFNLPVSLSVWKLLLLVFMLYSVILIWFTACHKTCQITKRSTILICSQHQINNII